MATTIDDAKLKEIMKAALIEVLEERRDLMTDAMYEVMEDIGLARAIDEGMASPLVPESEIMKALGKSE